MLMLSATNLTVSYHKWGQQHQALRGISLEVQTNEWVMLVGPNGSGKSTLLKTISGMLEPDSGEVCIEGERLADMSGNALSEKLFYLHQDPESGTAQDLTVFENLWVADNRPIAHKVSRGVAREHYRDILRRTGLDPRLDQLAGSLSGGERRLLTLAIAGLRRAPLILLDEPLAAVDQKRSDLCMQEISRLYARGKTLILITHDRDLPALYGSRIVALAEGRIMSDSLRSQATPV